MRFFFAFVVMAMAACSHIKRANMTSREASLRYYEDHHMAEGNPPSPRRGGGRLILSLHHTEMNDSWSHSVHSEWLNVEMDVSSLEGVLCIPSERVRLFGGEGGGMLGRAPHFQVVSAQGTISLWGKAGLSLDVKLDLTLSLARLDARKERRRRVRGVCRFSPAFVRLNPGEGEPMKRALRKSYQAKGARIYKWAVLGMSLAGITLKDAVEATMEGSVVEDHKWSDAPSCLILGKTSEGRRLLVWCAWPPQDGLVIRNALEPTKDHPDFAEYSEP